MQVSGFRFYVNFIDGKIVQLESAEFRTVERRNDCELSVEKHFGKRSCFTLYIITTIS